MDKYRGSAALAFSLMRKLTVNIFTQKTLKRPTIFVTTSMIGLITILFVFIF
jgi:hypothetical protein